MTVCCYGHSAVNDCLLLWSRWAHTNQSGHFLSLFDFAPQQRFQQDLDELRAKEAELFEQVCACACCSSQECEGLTRCAHPSILDILASLIVLPCYNTILAKNIETAMQAKHGGVHA